MFIQSRELTLYSAASYKYILMEQEDEGHRMEAVCISTMAASLKC